MIFCAQYLGLGAIVTRTRVAGSGCVYITENNNYGKQIEVFERVATLKSRRRTFSVEQIPSSYNV